MPSPKLPASGLTPPCPASPPSSPKGLSHSLRPNDPNGAEAAAFSPSPAARSPLPAGSLLRRFVLEGSPHFCAQIRLDLVFPPLWHPLLADLVLTLACHGTDLTGFRRKRELFIFTVYIFKFLFLCSCSLSCLRGTRGGPAPPSACQTRYSISSLLLALTCLRGEGG